MGDLADQSVPLNRFAPRGGNLFGDPFFPGPVSYLNRIRACFVETGVLSACPAFFRSRCIPLEVSVEDHDLENHGLGIGIRAENG